MLWRIRDGADEYELTLRRSGAPQSTTDDDASRVLSPDDAIDVLGPLARDPIHLAVLRDIHIAVAGTDGGRSLSDFVIVAGILDAIHMDRLAMRRLPPRVERTDSIAPEADDDIPELRDLASLPASAAAVAAPLEPAIVHQIEILARAAENGTPFCEECECE